MTRRDMLMTTAGAISAAGLASVAGAAPKVLKNMGLAPSGLRARRDAVTKAGNEFDLVEYCHEQGLGAADLSMRNIGDLDEVARIREQLNKYDMRISSVVQTPRSDDDVPQYEAMIKALSEMDGRVACIIDKFSGRRYEQFKTADEFHKFFAMCKEAVQRAEPILRKYKMRLAVENHKGWRSAEQVEWLKALGSEYVGVNFDMCNNVAMVEGPDQTLETLAPLTICVSFKDLAADFYDEGILLSEVPLGEGYYDLPAVVALLQKNDPNILFQLEMITRDPLEVPIFTEQYWKVWDNQSPAPARDLAMLIDWVRKNPPKAPLPKISGLTPEQQLALEDDFNKRCIDYARANLPL